MIYPRLNRVRNGQRLSVQLVNGLIKRTEYAGDLLRQGKCLAGTDISVAQRYDGTTISGGGESRILICGARFASTAPFTRVPFIYDYSNNLYTDLQNIPKAMNDGIYAFGIHSGVMSGHFFEPLKGFGRGFVYSNNAFTIINEGGELEFNTLLYKNNGSLAVGYSDAPLNIDAAIIYSISTGTFSKKLLVDYQHTDIFENIICGRANISGSFRGYTFDVQTNEIVSTFNYPAAQTTTAYGIYQNTIVGWYQNFSQQARGYLYDGVNFSSHIHPDSVGSTRFYGIAGDFVVGSFVDGLAGGLRRGLIYNKKSETYERLSHPSGQNTEFFGIDKSFF